MDDFLIPDDDDPDDSDFVYDIGQEDFARVLGSMFAGGPATRRRSARRS
jgi:hypothetical protein